MRVFVKVLKTTALRTLREPANVVFMIAFAPTFMLIMGLIFGNDPRKEFGGQGFLDANVTAFPGIVVAIAAIIILPVDLVTQRETGVLRRFRATPLRPAVYMSADLTVRVALSLLSIACLYAVAIAGFGVGADAMRVVNVLLATALGLCSFMALGYLLAGFLPSQGAAQGIGNILVYPLIFLSGAAVPLSQLPEGVAAVARFSPLTQLTFLTKGLWEGEGWIRHWGSAASLIAMGALCGVLAARCFRWEK